MSDAGLGVILVVEDDDVNRSFLDRFLSDHGFMVSSVASGEEGLALLKERAFDLILLDLMLPGKNGGEVAWAVRQRGVQTPIVAISAAMDQWFESDLEDLGVSRTIPKPFDNDELLQTVRELLGLGGVDRGEGVSL